MVVKRQENPQRRRVEVYSGRSLPSVWDWYWTDERLLYLQPLNEQETETEASLHDGTTSNHAASPDSDQQEEGYTHTLVFPLFGGTRRSSTTHGNIEASSPVQVDNDGNRNEITFLLGQKQRGFGQGSVNGFGGKLLAHETPLECALRELHEECNLQISPPSHQTSNENANASSRMLTFKARLNIHVQESENISIAIFTTTHGLLGRDRLKEVKDSDEMKCIPLHIPLSDSDSHSDGPSLEIFRSLWKTSQSQESNLTHASMETGTQSEEHPAKLDPILPSPPPSSLWPLTSLRPEHRIYLPILIWNTIQTTAPFQGPSPVSDSVSTTSTSNTGHSAVTRSGSDLSSLKFIVDVQFHQQVNQNDLPPGERPENHRRIKSWKLKILEDP